MDLVKLQLESADFIESFKSLRHSQVNPDFKIAGTNGFVCVHKEVLRAYSSLTKKIPSKTTEIKVDFASAEDLSTILDLCYEGTCVAHLNRLPQLCFVSSKLGFTKFEKHFQDLVASNVKNEAIDDTFENSPVEGSEPARELMDCDKQSEDDNGQQVIRIPEQTAVDGESLVKMEVDDTNPVALHEETDSYRITKFTEEQDEMFMALWLKFADCKLSISNKMISRGMMETGPTLLPREVGFRRARFRQMYKRRLVEKNLPLLNKFLPQLKKIHEIEEQAKAKRRACRNRSLINDQEAQKETNDFSGEVASSSGESVSLVKLEQDAVPVNVKIENYNPDEIVSAVLHNRKVSINEERNSASVLDEVFQKSELDQSSSTAIHDNLLYGIDSDCIGRMYHDQWTKKHDLIFLEMWLKSANIRRSNKRMKLEWKKAGLFVPVPKFWVIKNTFRELYQKHLQGIEEKSVQFIQQNYLCQLEKIHEIEMQVPRRQKKADVISQDTEIGKSNSHAGEAASSRESTCCVEIDNGQPELEKKVSVNVSGVQLKKKKRPKQQDISINWTKDQKETFLRLWLYACENPAIDLKEELAKNGLIMTVASIRHGKLRFRRMYRKHLLKGKNQPYIKDYLDLLKKIIQSETNPQISRKNAKKGNRKKIVESSAIILQATNYRENKPKLELSEVKDSNLQGFENGSTVNGNVVIRNEPEKTVWTTDMVQILLQIWLKYAQRSVLCMSSWDAIAAEVVDTLAQQGFHVDCESVIQKKFSLENAYAEHGQGHVCPNIVPHLSLLEQIKENLEA